MIDLIFGWYCKTLIRSVQRRLRIFKTEKPYNARRLRAEATQLLKKGRYQSAYIWAEQIYKDESVLPVAYDLLDTMCETIVLNLPYIRRTMDCPNNINEAVSSLVFASSKCGHLFPELLVLRKLFGERYGERLIVAALELHPGNLVNPQIRDNLAMESVPSEMKYRLMVDFAMKCLELGPLALDSQRKVVISLSHCSKVLQVKGDNFQQPSPHVHPKLPDYDEFAAIFKALKKVNQLARGVCNQNQGPKESLIS